MQGVLGAFRELDSAVHAIEDLRKQRVGDVTVFNPDTDWKVDPKKFVSKGRNMPYGGRELRGKVHYTIVGGRIVHRPAQG